MLNNLAVAAAPAASSSSWSTIMLAVIGSGVVAALVSTIAANLRTNAAARRDRYAQAVRILVAWAEYPYRIRRRTDDELATLNGLAAHGHTLQEDRAEISGWIAAESRTMKVVFDQCVHDLNDLVRPAIRTAWKSPPITTPADMTIGDLGITGLADIAARMAWACRYRFGLRRLMWPSWVLHRLAKGTKQQSRPSARSATVPAVPPSLAEHPRHLPSAPRAVDQ